MAKGAAAPPLVRLVLVPHPTASKGFGYFPGPFPKPSAEFAGGFGGDLGSLNLTQTVLRARSSFAGCARDARRHSPGERIGP